MTMTEVTRRQEQLAKEQAQLAKVQAVLDRIFGTLILTGMIGIITLAIMVRG